MLLTIELIMNALEKTIQKMKENKINRDIARMKQWQKVKQYNELTRPDLT